MTKLLLSVGCANSEACDLAESFYIELSDADIQRIKQLSDVVTQAHAYSIEEFHYGSYWSYMLIDSSEVEDDYSNLEEVVALMQEEAARVEVTMLNVTKDQFYFTAVPKHCGDDLALATARVSLSDLDDTNTLLNLN